MLKFTHLIDCALVSVIRPIEHPALGWTYHLERFMDSNQETQLKRDIHVKVSRLLYCIAATATYSAVSLALWLLDFHTDTRPIMPMITTVFALYYAVSIARAYRAYAGVVGISMLIKK